jgi:hypothetical protein
MPLLTLLTANGRMHKTGGLNWGFNPRNHTTPDDAYIPIHLATIRNNPGFFLPKPTYQTVLTFTWDDGTVMQGRFEASQFDRRTGTKYPKNISSYPSKAILGRYLRSRINVYGRRVTIADLQAYGRTDVMMTQTGPNQYYLDFS